MTAVEATGTLGHVTDALHFDDSFMETRPLVNPVFDIAFHHGRPAKKLEMQLVVFPDGGRMRRVHAKRPWANIPWPYIERGVGRCMVMYDHQRW